MLSCATGTHTRVGFSVVVQIDRESGRWAQHGNRVLGCQQGMPNAPTRSRVFGRRRRKNRTLSRSRIVGTGATAVAAEPRILSVVATANHQTTRRVSHACKSSECCWESHIVADSECPRASSARNRGMSQGAPRNATEPAAYSGLRGPRRHNHPKISTLWLRSVQSVEHMTPCVASHGTPQETTMILSRAQRANPMREPPRVKAGPDVAGTQVRIPARPRPWRLVSIALNRMYTMWQTTDARHFVKAPSLANTNATSVHGVDPVPMAAQE